MEHKKLVSTARLTGIWYLLLAITGVLGFIVFHPQIFVAGDPQKTLTNLTELESTARIRLVLELFIIASQALAAVWFFKLFVEIKAWAAFAIGGWGLMNAAAIMVSAIAMAAAIEVAQFATPAFQEKVISIQLLSTIISSAWIVGSLFFGLWLIPMGAVVITSKRMPIWLGRILIIGGIGYVLSTFFSSMGFAHPLLEFLTIPATIGEFWMIGYLLIFGIRPLDNTEQ
ncbi:MAG: hypothetical protein COW03_16090 [Cytophagales bacterium CG12_big_fil_rev_8_21_14_0_65_40_12]|nr:MAG: hypothetical protein COW03_16090 [Cytophagales bacterium CG12_big_fil_rev_8_21_14_0_65_40_12]PIW06069.1 MAG: DUF4386 domain-containing protein [Cytophagales bacterium CG17_big_fil_post_rev_8_21_14_2_50_40_13]